MVKFLARRKRGNVANLIAVEAKCPQFGTGRCPTHRIHSTSWRLDRAQFGLRRERFGPIVGKVETDKLHFFEIWHFAQGRHVVKPLQLDKRQLRKRRKLLEQASCVFDAQVAHLQKRRVRGFSRQHDRTIELVELVERNPGHVITRLQGLERRESRAFGELNSDDMIDLG